MQVPYAQLSAEQSRDHIANDLSRRCGSRALTSAEAKALHREEISGGKFVVNVEMPELQLASGRKTQMATYGACIFILKCRLTLIGLRRKSTRRGAGKLDIRSSE